MKMSVLNKDWFKERLAAIQMSQRQLAKKMDVDPAAISYMLAGKRDMSLDEAKKIADIFEVNVTEVMRQTGVNVTDDVRMVPIVGYISKGYEVIRLPKGTYERVMAPADVSSKCYALQHRDSSHPRDAWLSFVSGDQESAHVNIDHYCLVTIEDGVSVMALIRRGYQSGTYNLLIAPEFNEVMTNKKIVWCSRVMWVQPS